MPSKIQRNWLRSGSNNNVKCGGKGGNERDDLNNFEEKLLSYKLWTRKLETARAISSGLVSPPADTCFEAERNIAWLQTQIQGPSK
jgi:hypothetical protein